MARGIRDPGRRAKSGCIRAGARGGARRGGGIGGKYYDSKQQETVMDRRERAHGPRAAFPLYKSPPVLRY